MAIGIPYALSKESYPIPEAADVNKILALAKRTCELLGWTISATYKNGLVVNTGFEPAKGLRMSDFGHHIMIRVDSEMLHIRSQSEPLHFFDKGKNRENILAFSAKYKELSDLGFESSNQNHETDTLYLPDEDTSVFHNIIGKPHRVIATPILIAVNALIFILMAANGVNILNPDSEALLRWGADFRPEVLNGAYWRLLSSCFVHIGIFHLAMNMYALVYVGRLLEPLMGYAKFTSAYLLAGVAASVTSMYWHEYTVSAGASGAIFGMFGLFLFLLTTELIDKKTRKPMLVNLSVFIGYNLLIGTSQGFDNAAHIGGLLSGVVIGYFLYKTIKNPDQPKPGWTTIAGMLLALVVGSYFVLSNLGNDYGIYQKRMARYYEIQDDALLPYTLFDTGRSDKYLLEVIEKDGQENWKRALNLIDSLEVLDLPDETVLYNERLKTYCSLHMNL